MFQSAEVVGWVELRETHHESRELVGLVKLDPPYILKDCSALRNLPPMLTAQRRTVNRE